jgi:hypothetical protein
MRGDDLLVGPAGVERRERRPGVGRPKGIQPPVSQVGDARGETDPKQVGKPENMIADATTISVVGSDAEISLVVEQPVDDMSRLAGSGNRRGIERRMAVGDVRVEQRCRLIT